MVNEAELFLDAGTMFGKEGTGFERINIACPRSVLEEALARLLVAARRRGKEKRLTTNHTNTTNKREYGYNEKKE
jgi:hypothetical protein